MKKIGSLMLALLLLLPLAAGCGESKQNADAPQETAVNTGTDANPNPTAEAETEPEETVLTDGLPDTNFDGYEFRIACGQGNGVPMAEYAVFTDDYTGVPVKDALRDSTLYVEERFNVKIRYDTYGNDANLYTKSIQTADNAFDCIIAPDYITYSLAPKGMLLDMKTIDQFDFSKPWWPPIMLGTLTVCDSLYAMSSYLSYLGLHWTRALMVNKDLADVLGVGVPYDKVREGTWTLDEMISYVKDTASDANGDGKIGPDDRLGFVTGSQTYYCFQESMGISPYGLDEEGNYTLTFDIDRADGFIERIRAFMATDDYCDAGDFFGSAVFVKGQTLLNLGEIGDAYDIYSSYDFTYGFLPCPKYDEAQENYINCCTDGPWGIPTTVTGDQKDLTGTICEALSCYNYQHVLPVYFEVTMKKRLADSPDDAEMLSIIADTRTTSFAYAFDLPFKNIVADTARGSVGMGSYAAKTSRSAEKLLARLIDNFEKQKNN